MAATDPLLNETTCLSAATNVTARARTAKNLYSTLMIGRRDGEAVRGLRGCGFWRPVKKTYRFLYLSTQKTRPQLRVLAGPMSVVRIIGLASCELRCNIQLRGRLAGSIGGLPFFRAIP